MQWLAVSSDKGTMHIFSLRVRAGGEDASNGKSAIAGRQIDRSHSSGSIDPLLLTNTGSNVSSSLSFMKGENTLLLVVNPLVDFDLNFLILSTCKPLRKYILSLFH